MKLLYSLLFSISLNAGYLQYVSNHSPTLNDEVVAVATGATGCYNLNITGVDNPYSSTGTLLYLNTTGKKLIILESEIHREFSYNLLSSISTCPSGQVYSDNCICTTCDEGVVNFATGVCEPPPTPECTLPEILDTDTNTCINPDTDGDGIPDVCDTDSDNYNSSDCDGDGIPNDTDTDIDGDGIPNVWDDTKNIPDESEGAPTCSELLQIAEYKCPYNLQFECVSGNPDYVIKNICLAPDTPCDIYFDNLNKTCDTTTHQINGSCSDNGLQFTNNTLKCELKEVLPPDCSLSWNEVLDTDTNTCVCEIGYFRNSFGNCWKSLLDDNATAEQIAEDERNQALDNEVKTEEKKEDEQKAFDSNLSTQILQQSIDTADTLKGIRDDINSSNGLLSNIGGKIDDTNSLLDDIKSLFSPDSVSIDYISNEMGTILNKYTVDLYNGSCGSISPVTITFRGETLTFLNQGHIDKLPMSSMRSIMIFLFTISALSIIFRSN